MVIDAYVVKKKSTEKEIIIKINIMQVRVDTDEFKMCGCGSTPDHYEIGYGRTPYSLMCPGCKKQLIHAKCKITGCGANLIDYWNEHLRLLTPLDMDNENQELCEEREKEDPYNEAIEYQYYWVEGKGERLITRY